MHEARKRQLAEFVEYVENHITGDEKGEAQIFLDRMFQAFGHKGLKEAGAVCEQRRAPLLACSAVPLFR